MSMYIYNLNAVDHERALSVIHQLSLLDDYDEAAVLTIIDDIGTDLFLALDESPGHWGYKDPLTQREWHCWLRRARNGADGFFEAVGGYHK